MYIEDYNRNSEALRVLKRGGKYYLKLKPEVLYDTKEEAEKISQEYEEARIFF